MSHKKTHIVVNLDKSAVRAEIPYLDYHTARRMQGPIYDVLIQELNEHGCKASAKYFRCLSNKEDSLYNLKIIRQRVQDDRKLLYQLFDYCIAAEKAYDFRECGGLTASFYIMYQLLELIQERGTLYQWLLTEVFKIVMKIIRHIDPKGQQPNEMITRLYYMYGLYLSHLQDANSIKYLRDALELCRGQKWWSECNKMLDEAPCASASSDTDGIKTLHEVVVHSLAEVKLKFAETFGKFGKHSDVATELSKEAMLLVAELGIGSNKFEFYSAFVTYAKFLEESSKFNAALKLLNRGSQYFNQDDIKLYSRFYCKQLIIRGCCHAGLKDIKQAKKCHQQAIKIARNSKYRDLEAQALVYLGMLYTLKKVEYNIGKTHYEDARLIFLELGDRENETKTHYLLAKLRADEMFPFFMDILKYTAISPCNMYKLRRWKNVCEPFWVNFNEFLQKVTEDPLSCLLDVKSDMLIDTDRKIQSISRQSVHQKQLADSTSFRSISSKGSTTRYRRGRPSRAFKNSTVLSTFKSASSIR